MLSRGDPHQAAHRGTVLFFHGHGGAKESIIDHLTYLADAGFLVVGLDNVGHGERRYPDFAARFDWQNNAARFAGEFVAAMHATAREVPAVIDALLAQGLALRGRIGVTGISMGGGITYAAALADKRVGAAAPIVADPEWGDDDPDSPHRHLDRFFPVALLSQTGGNDKTLPPDEARKLHTALEPYYTRAPERLCYIEYAGATHDLSAEIWQQALKNVALWFARFLGGA
jgi:dienelactone hydrolase